MNHSLNIIQNLKSSGKNIFILARFIRHLTIGLTLTKQFAVKPHNLLSIDRFIVTDNDALTDTIYSINSIVSSTATSILDQETDSFHNKRGD